MATDLAAALCALAAFALPVGLAWLLVARGDRRGSAKDGRTPPPSRPRR
ncbi:hypothetical protein [Rhodoferax koreensis]|nr:hypothetical protein [Rhodoferax koreense]